jgi:hypothetical protein
VAVFFAGFFFTNTSAIFKWPEKIRSARYSCLTNSARTLATKKKILFDGLESEGLGGKRGDESSQREAPTLCKNRKG